MTDLANEAVECTPYEEYGASVDSNLDYDPLEDERQNDRMNDLMEAHWTNRPRLVVNNTSAPIKRDLSRVLFPELPDVAPTVAVTELTGSQIAAKFIADMFSATEAPVFLTSLGNERNGVHAPKSIHANDTGEVASFVANWDKHGRGMFFSVGTVVDGKERSKATIVETVGLHVDIDLKDVAESVDDIERLLKTRIPNFPPSIINRSGHGVHAYWLFREAIRGEMERVEAALHQLCDLVGGDTLPAHIAGLMRLPGSHNSKRGEWTPVTISHQSDRRYELDDLEEMLAETSPIILKKERQRAVTAGEFDPYAEYGVPGFKPRVDVKARLDAMMFMGGGDAAIHATQLSVSASMLNAGHDIDDVVEVLLRATKAASGDYGKRWNWRIEEKSIRKMCVSWVKNHPPKTGAAPADDRDNVIPFEARNTKPAPQPIEIFWHGKSYERAIRLWLIDNLIPQTGQGLASSQWGAGKTFAGLDLAASVMTGTPFAGREVGRRGGVLFIAAEGASEIPIRLEGVVDHKLRPNSSIAGVDLDNLPFAWIEECPSLKEDVSFERLVAIVLATAAQMKEKFKVDLVLIEIDTLSASADFADANDAAEGQRIMNRLNTLSRRTGAFVLAVDHFGKAVETGTRGSSAKEAAADVVLAILADRDVSGTISNTRLAVRKLRGGATGAETPFDLRVVDLEFDETTCVIEWKPDRAPQAKGQGTGSKNPWQAAKVLRSALGAALVDHGIMMQPYGSEGPNVRVVPLRLLRSEFMASYPAEGDTEQQKQAAKRKAFQRQLKSARDKSLICSREVGGDDQVWLVDDSDRTAITGTDGTGL